jgi:hypothetical protein
MQPFFTKFFRFSSASSVKIRQSTTISVTLLQGRLKDRRQARQTPIT